MRKNRRPYKRDARFTERSYKPYVIGIGQVALAWNDLHEKLGEIFVALLEGNTSLDNADVTTQLAAVWSAANSDRTKRDMLKAAVTLPRNLEGGPFPRLREDILWVIGQAGKLEDRRNDIVHAPLLSLVSPGMNNSIVIQYLSILAGSDVIPNLLMQNARAAKLAGKNPKGQMLDDFRWVRDSILALRDYATLIRLGIVVEGRPWPDRPPLPNAGQKRTARRRRFPAK